MRGLITTATLAAMVLGAGFAIASEPYCGDVNASGTVTSTDALLVLKDAVGQNVVLQCALCGDGNIEAGEDCESGNLNGNTCVSQGFAGGTLLCATGCTFDTSGCYATRFDASGATILDRKTNLEWEKKDAADNTPNLADPHDVDNLYTWCAGTYPSCTNPNSPFDGTASTDFLARLNGGSTGTCYAGHCDWRLPTIEELKSIIVLFCDKQPCVVDDVFLPTRSSAYWSSTTHEGTLSEAWYVDYSSAPISFFDYNAKTAVVSFRAVRSQT